MIFMTTGLSTRTFVQECQDAAVFSVEHGEPTNVYTERVRQIEKRFHDWLWHEHGTGLSEEIHEQVVDIAYVAGGNELFSVESYYKNIVRVMKAYATEQS